MTPLRIWSSSMDSNSALKFPSPNPSLPLRWMISKKMGPITLAVNICSSTPSEFVPLPFVHMEAPLYLKGRARRGPTFREAVLMHAVARLALHPHIQNIQVSWVKMGVEGVKACLQAGCNDLGGTLMNESITRAAGTQHGQELPPEQMEQIIRSIGRTPRQRTTLYGIPPEGQQIASFGAPEIVYSV